MELNKYVKYNKFPHKFSVKDDNSDLFHKCCNFVANYKLTYFSDGAGYVNFTMPTESYHDARHFECSHSLEKIYELMDTNIFTQLVERMIKNESILKSYYL
jgi:hypothetical protein